MRGNTLHPRSPLLPAPSIIMLLERAHVRVMHEFSSGAPRSDDLRSVLSVLSWAAARRAATPRAFGAHISSGFTSDAVSATQRS